jgi:hypothetical protein
MAYFMKIYLLIYVVCAVSKKYLKKLSNQANPLWKSLTEVAYLLHIYTTTFAEKYLVFKKVMFV